MQSCGTEPSPPSPLLSLPPELHLKVLSYLPSIEDQVSASLSHRIWRNLLRDSNNFLRLRYTTNGLNKQPGLHCLLSPPHTWLGVRTTAGKVNSCWLSTFDRQKKHWLYLFANTYRDEPERYSDLQRSNADLFRPIRSVDISTCPFLDESLFNPHLRSEDMQAPPTKLTPAKSLQPAKRVVNWNSLHNYRAFELMRDEGFPILVCWAEGFQVERNFTRRSVSKTDGKGMTIKKLLDVLAREITDIMEAEGIDTSYEHSLVIDQAIYQPGDLRVARWGVRATILPSNEDERVAMFRKLEEARTSTAVTTIREDSGFDAII
ncbi:hypothetical protein H072_5473 [Dactylellina haptotyla CBS 200.50]|uniref:F-box domain-containing protein n=1 Tax=Dactylellina haptotyla (strain CBS 200.50) TaxID=1284197 RepID=S8BZ67_DACHA|nr:hypothetical protein H072_5473 [Dactylellina haptotyla CBS 200.50]